MNDSISLKLQTFFSEKQISQTSIAELLGVSKAYINALLTGRKRFGRKQAEIWENHFGLSKSWLLTGEGEMLKKDNDSVRMIGRPKAAMPEELFEVRLFEVSPTASFQEFCAGVDENPDTIPVIPYGSEKIDDSYCVFEIHGDSMAPRICDRAKVLCREIPPSRWHTMPDGVVAIAYADKFVIKRIRSNDLDLHNSITLGSDNPEFPAVERVPLSEIRAIFKAIRIISSDIL